jgi:two-component system, response regulator PdtaR
MLEFPTMHRFAKVYFQPDIIAALESVTADSAKPLGPSDTVAFIVRDWLIANGYLVATERAEWRDVVWQDPGLAAPEAKVPILVVEDDEFARINAVGMAEIAGFDVLTAECSADAIVVLNARPDIRLVFTDIRMPGEMDGAKLAEFIHEKWPDMLLMVTTAAAFPEPQSLPVGARFYSKPYEMTRLIDGMRTMIATADAGLQAA